MVQLALSVSTLNVASGRVCRTCDTAGMTWEARRGNLPVVATTLVGREAAVAEVGELVRANQLVTLTGVGGVGKTRLAIAVANELENEFPDGSWIVDLASLGDPGAVPDAIAAVLGITPRGETPAIDAIADAIAGRRLLLLMDSCEHVLGVAASAIGTILDRAGSARILATSRELLGTPNESLVGVAPLGLEGGTASESVSLFLDRARTVRPGFTLERPEAAAAVVEICETLDGLPLGIELAAARMAAMSPVEVRDRLGDRLRLLIGPEHGAAHQLTLRRTVEWSYDLLEEAERAVLRMASVFSGGFYLGALGSVMETGDDVELLGRLDSLVRKSLVRADHSRDHTRYGLFDTIRLFAEERLSAAGELEPARDRHAAQFARDAVRRWESWNGPGWRSAVDWVEIELANLRSAFRWGADRGDAEVATDIAAHTALMGFSVELFETVGWAESYLGAATEADALRLPRLYTAAGYACFAGRAAEGAVHAHRATELESESRYESCEPGYAKFVEALGAVYSGDLARYVELTAAVAALPGRAYGIAAYVDGLQSAGRIEEALGLTGAAIVAARHIGNPFWIAYALWVVGLAFSKVDPARALAAWEEGVEVVRAHGIHFFEGYIARDAALMHTASGDVDPAIELLLSAIAAFHRAGNVAQLVITLAIVPALFERLDDLRVAAILFGAMSRESASFHHVPDLVDVGERIAVKLGVKSSERLVTEGGAMDLNAAATYAREQLEIALQTLRKQQAGLAPGGLTRREVQVLRLVADGATTRDIAEQLFISSKTADHHIQHIYTKIGVINRAAATRWALDHGVVGSGVADAAPVKS